MRGQVRAGERDMRQITAQWQRARRRLFDRALETQHPGWHRIFCSIARRAAHLRSVDLCLRCRTLRGIGVAGRLAASGRGGKHRAITLTRHSSPGIARQNCVP